MSLCPGCGTENQDTAVFCVACGDVIDWDSSSGTVMADRAAGSVAPSIPPSTPAAPPPTPPAPQATPPPPAPQATPPPPPARSETAPPPPAPSPTAPPRPAPSATAPSAPSAPGVPPLTPPAPTTTPPPPPAAEPDPARAERMRRLVAKSNLVPAARPADEVPAADAVEEPAAVVATPPESRATPTSPPASTVLPRTLPAPAAKGSAAPTAPSSLAAAIQIAERSGRTDLASRLRANRERIRRTGVTIAVVGEFKKGKSTLVNALVNAEVCPSDPVDATVVPITVAHGEELTVTVEFNGQPAEVVDVEQVAAYGTESGNEGNRLKVTRIDVGLPRRLLASGMAVVDTPGVGGLESAAGALNLATLDHADGVLFVTDCSQELTAPEVTYLAAARDRCESVVCVMTKADLHLAAGTLADHNRRHLAAAGLGDIPVLTVSSVLHLLSLAQGDARLERESGFADLFDVVHTRIWEPARRRELAEAGEQLADLADHLSLPLEAAQQAKGSEQAAQQTIARLSEAQDRVRQFRSGAARWQQRLAEGMQDASVDLDHDLRTRVRTLARMVEGRVDTDDPADDLVFEAWVHKMVIEEVVGHYELIAERANALAEEIDQHFATLDREAAFRVDAAVPAELLAAVHVNREQQVVKDNIARRMITTGQGYSSGIVLFSSVVGIVSALPWIPVLALPFAGFMAKRAFSDDRQRRKSARGQELKRLATRYLDEIGFIVHKDSRDTVRRIQRDIREHYARRAEQLELTLQQAMASAERARASSGPPPGEAEDQATIRDMVAVARRLTDGLAVAS